MGSKHVYRDGTEETKETEFVEPSRGDLTSRILAAAFEVHTVMGPGLLETAYVRSMACELALRGIEFSSQVVVPIRYKGQVLDTPLRLDLIVGGEVIVEIKAVAKVEEVHRAQLLTYLRMTDLRIGLLINFHVESLRHGIRRVFNAHKTSFPSLTPFTPGK